MASYSAALVKSATLSGTTVDTVTLTSLYQSVEVLNRGSNALSFTVGGATPTALGDNCFVVPAGEALAVPVPSATDSTTGTVVKIIGNGDAYTVTGITRW